MSFCTIKRNAAGKITRVNKPDGSESKLFTRIAKHPLVKDTEVAADIYKNIFSKELDNRAEDTQEFFSSVVTGKNDKYIPSRSYEYEYNFNEAEENFKQDYQQRLGDFDDHIATSIPTFRDIQIKKGAALVEMYSSSPKIENSELISIKNNYIENSGLEIKVPNYSKVDYELFDELAEYHKNVKDDRFNKEMEESYIAFLEETKAQFNLLVENGYDLQPWMKEGEPYGVNSKLVREDVLKNKRLYYLRSASATGTNDSTDTAENYIPFRESGIEINGDKVLFNDLFRAVHDIFGHSMVRNSFSTQGELDAYKTHSVMYSEKAQKALFLETVMYNAWYNKNKNYAPRKIYNVPQKFIDAVNKEVDFEEGAVIYDLGGSEGGFVKTITSQSNGSIESINLEANQDMVDSHNASPVTGSIAVKEAFYEGFDDVLKHTPKVKADVVHESMLFQFITPQREQFIDEIIENYMREDGLLITEEKFQTSDVAEYAENERFKNENHKAKYFTEEQIKAKGESVLVGMKENQAMLDDYVSLLKKKFDFVEVYWSSGNFKGIVASNNESKIKEFISKLGDTSSEYSETRYRKDEVREATPMEFKVALDRAFDTMSKQSTNLALQMDNMSIEALEKIVGDGGKLFLTKDNQAGAFVKADGYMGGLFRNPMSTKKQASKVLQEVRLDAGGTYFDAYGTKLEDIYIKNGFRPVARIPFDESQAPEGWDSDKSPLKSKPDVVFFIFDPNNESKVGDGQMFDSYDEARKFTMDTLDEVGPRLDNEDNIGFVHRLKDGTTIASYKETLTLAKEGDTIEIGLMVEGTFNPVVLTRKNTNKNTEQGYINNIIKNGLLSENKTKVGVDYVYEAAGETEMSKVLNASLIQEDANAYLGSEGVIQDGFTFKLEKTRDKIKVMDYFGGVEVVSKSELDALSYEEIKDRFDNATDIITQREWAASKVAYRDTDPVISQRAPVKSEEELQLRLLNLLSKMGVKTMSINEYSKKYKIKNGVNPSAKALADIANQVVAYTKGDVISLSEEAAHFINEAFPKEKIENILRNIHKTEEYAEFNRQYRNIYSKEYSEEALEDVVRREVLGKIVAKVISGQTEAKTELQRNLFERVLDAINDLFENLRNLFRTEYSEELNQYLSEVEDMLSAEDISDYVNVSNFKDNKLRLYNIGNENSAVNKLRKKASLLAFKLQDTEKKILSAGSGSKSSVRDLDKVQRDLENALTVQSILSLVSMVNSNVRSLNAAIKDSKEKNKPYFLSDEENVVYQTVKQVSSNAISEMKVLLQQIKAEQKTDQWDNILKEIDDTILSIQQLNAEANLIDSQNVQRLVNKIMDENNIPEEERQLVTKWIEKAEADTNLFHSTFGQLVHAKDGLLNLSGQIIRDMHNEAQVTYFQATKRYQDRLKELGVTESEIGQKLVDGQYIVSEYDFNSFKQQMDSIYAETYKSVINEVIEDDTVDSNRKAELKKFSEMSIEDIVKAKNNNELAVLTLNEETYRKNLERPKVTPLIERTMIDSYYDEYESKLKAANINDVTKQELSNYLSDISALKKKAYRKEGDATILDYNSLSEADKIRLSDLHKRRKMMKSYTDESGELKPGLKYNRVNGELELDPVTGQPVVGILDPSRLTEESIIALDINKLDREFTNDQAKQNAKLFFDTLDKIDNEQGREAAIKFLEANAYTTLSQDFWDNLNTGGNLVSRLEALKQERPDMSDEISETIFNIKIFTFKIKNIIKLHNRKNNPSEVEVELMSTTAKDSVKQLQKSLKEDIRKANQLLGDFQVEESEEGFLSGVSEVNESYRKELRALDIYEDPNDTEDDDIRKANEEVEFAKEHMSDENANLLESNRISIEQFLTGSRANVNQSVERVLDDLGYDVMDLNNPRTRAKVLRALTRNRLLPYYKRYTSEAYTDYMEGLQTAQNLSDFIQNSQVAKDAFVEVNPNPTFFDKQENDQLNPNYDNEFKGGYLQPKLSKFKNNKFTELFGTINNGQASKNNNLYQAYLATIEYNEQALQAMNVGETYNKYLLPQIRQQQIQRFSTLLKNNPTQNIKNFVKDALSYTEDDLIQGEQMFGQEVKVIPKMYINKLENPEDVSNDLFFSLALRAKEAYSRQAKVKYYGDLMSVYDKISTREMNGKDPKASNTYKMMKSAIDYNLFGVKETVTYPVKTPIGTIDLTKMARMLLNFVKFRNLGLNIVIPITSMLTGEVTRKMETTVGEFIDSRSQKLGTREYRKIASDGMKEIGEINTEAKINVLGQFFKAFDMNESFNNSNYSKFLRFLPRTGMALHSAANYALYGKTMIGVLHDFRIVEGKMVNKNDFMKAKKKEGVSMDEAKKMWRESEDTVMYKYLVHDKNQVNWNREALKEVLRKDGRELTEEELDDAIQDMFTKAQRYISLVNSLIDGQIPEEDRVLAQRHYLLSYFMTHRGWLSIAIARRFKNRHLNLDTNITEEGSYRSFYGYMGTFFKEWREGNFYNFVGAFKEAWNESDELTRRNMRRVAIESGMLSTLMILSIALRAAADDEDNEDVFGLQLANYLSYRTLNELSSVQFNIGSNMFEAIESPFVGMNTIKNLYDVGELFSGEEVKHGSYRGMSKRRRYITKMVPGMKQYFDLQNMNQTYDTYKFYNTKNFSLTPANVLWANTVDRKD